ncbi:MAG: HAD-IB family hydrolase [Chloroflexi bacterium]|nr:HAD-IB family hydrolase [Chloroflexota bacterium]
MGIAFFDMDKTLLSTSSGVLYIQYLWQRRLINMSELVSVLVISTQYALNFLNFPKAMARMSRSIKGGDAVATKALCDQWFLDQMVHYIAPKAVERLRQHEQRSDAVILLSASTQFAVEPVARHLNIPYRCTELEIKDNRFTGNVVGMHCYAEGKCYWAERIAKEHNVSLAECTFYSDSYSDHSLLESVGHPVVVNPDRKLRGLAQLKDWPVELFY